ncbi:hypothetical protein VDGL01_00937 [Verticillium dahliae]|nr:hypothetical protein VdG2_00986 [Verticillium dahliae VDG2]
MPPSNSISRMAQYARGLPDPNANQTYNGASTYFPPASNPRDAMADSIKMPLPRASAPLRASAPPREVGAPTVEPPSSPGVGALPNPPRGLLARRRTNSADHPDRLWAPSLPSAIATPVGSPTSTSAETQDNDRERDYDLGITRRAASTVAVPRSPPRYIEPIRPLHANGLGNHNGMRDGSQGNNSRPRWMGDPSMGFLPSPTKRQTELPIHNVNPLKPFPEVSNLVREEYIKQEHRKSPSRDRPLPHQSKGHRDQARAQPRSAFFDNDADSDVRSLRSDMPLSDEEPGTPRPLKREGRRADVFSDDPPPTWAANRVITVSGKSKKRDRNNVDYDDKTLMRMSYSDLQNQPFDADPAQAASGADKSLVGETLPEKLEHYRSKSITEQKQFFAELDLGDWERSGDWFLEQFGRVAQKLKETRQNKRATVETFETELASREEAVRLRTENINLKLKKIKSKGEDMLADKAD